MMDDNEFQVLVLVVTWKALREAVDCRIEGRDRRSTFLGVGNLFWHRIIPGKQSGGEQS